MYYRASHECSSAVPSTYLMYISLDLLYFLQCKMMYLRISRGGTRWRIRSRPRHQNSRGSCHNAEIVGWQLSQCWYSGGSFHIVETIEEIITVLEQLGRLQSWKSRRTYYSGDRVRNLLTLPKQSGKFSHCCYSIPGKPIKLVKQLGKLLQRWNSRRKWSRYFNSGDLTPVLKNKSRHCHSTESV